MSTLPTASSREPSPPPHVVHPRTGPASSQANHTFSPPPMGSGLTSGNEKTGLSSGGSANIVFTDQEAEAWAMYFPTPGSQDSENNGSNDRVDSSLSQQDDSFTPGPYSREDAMLRSRELLILLQQFPGGLTIPIYTKRFVAEVKTLLAALPSSHKAEFERRVAGSLLTLSNAPRVPRLAMRVSALRIGVLGAGAIGCFVGTMLARSGIHRVTLVGRESLLESVSKTTYTTSTTPTAATAVAPTASPLSGASAVTPLSSTSTSTSTSSSSTPNNSLVSSFATSPASVDTASTSTTPLQLPSGNIKRPSPPSPSTSSATTTTTTTTTTPTETAGGTSLPPPLTNPASPQQGSTSSLSSSSSENVIHVYELGASKPFTVPVTILPSLSMSSSLSSTSTSATSSPPPTFSPSSSQPSSSPISSSLLSSSSSSAHPPSSPTSTSSLGGPSHFTSIDRPGLYVTTDVSYLRDVDVVLVCVKSADTLHAAEQLARLFAPTSVHMDASSESSQAKGVPDTDSAEETSGTSSSSSSDSSSPLASPHRGGSNISSSTASTADATVSANKNSGSSSSSSSSDKNDNSGGNNTGNSGDAVRQSAAGAGEEVTHVPLVLSLQNGVDNPQVLASVLPHADVAAGVVAYNVLADSRLAIFRRTTDGDITISLTHPSSVRRSPLSATAIHSTCWSLMLSMRAVGLAVDMISAEKCATVVYGKLAINLMNSINALSGLPLAAMLLDRQYREVCAAVIQEALSVYSAAGIQPAKYRSLPLWLFPVIFLMPTFLFKRIARKLISDPTARLSMLQDLDKGRRTEVDALNGAVVRLAMRMGSKSTINQRICGLVHLAEERAAAREKDRKRSSAGVSNSTATAHNDTTEEQKAGVRLRLRHPGAASFESDHPQKPQRHARASTATSTATSTSEVDAEAAGPVHFSSDELVSLIGQDVLDQELKTPRVMSYVILAFIFALLLGILRQGFKLLES